MEHAHLRRMRKGLSFFFAVFAAFVVIIPPRCEAGEPVALDVDLSQMYSVDLQSFIRAVVPEVYGGHAEKPLELNKLLSVYGFFLQGSYIAGGRDSNGEGQTRETLERLIREAIGKLDLATLRRMALGNEKTGRGDSLLLAALYQRVIQSEVARALASTKLKPAFPDRVAPLPEWFPISRSPADTTLLRKAAGPFLELLAKVDGKKMRGLHADGAGWGVLSDSFWKRPDRKVANEFLQIGWDSDCGNGFESFEADKMTMVFIGLLREKRISEALGASFLVPLSPELIQEPNRPFDQWRVDLLRFCGFDWEAVMLGLNRSKLLSSHGSERGAKQVLEAFKTSKDRALDVYRMTEMAAYLSPGSPNEWKDEDPRKAISVETQTEMFRVLDGAVSDDSDFQYLDPLMTLLERLRRPETKATMRRLLGHPSTTFSGRAARLLRVLGEDVADIPPAPDVRFRVFLNEKPWRSTRLVYSVVSDDEKSIAWRRELKTDADGFTAVPLDDFLDPAKKGKKLGFGHSPSGRSVYSDELYREAWVQAEVESPKVFDETINVNITAASLPIEIEYATAPVVPSDYPVMIRLFKADGSEADDSGFVLKYDNELVPPASLILTTIGLGRYRLFIDALGSARRVTQPFGVKAGMDPIRVKLEKGVAVFATVAIPGNARGAREYALFEGDAAVADLFYGYRWDATAPLFQGLPKGRYRLRLLSTEEYMRKWKITAWEAPQDEHQFDLRNGVDCEGTDVEFVIDENTPPMLDLGRIENNPFPAMREQARPMKVIRGKGIRYR